MEGRIGSEDNESDVMPFQETPRGSSRMSWACVGPFQMSTSEAK